MVVRVIVVDDSALMRQLLSEILNSDPDIEVVDTAADPFIAREKIKKHNPDVITLDVEMPRMNGLVFLTKLMSLRPMPVIMISSLTQEGTETSLKALELGAFDIVGKPTGFVTSGMGEIAEELTSKIKAASKAQIMAKRQAQPVFRLNAPQGFKDMVIAIGASTGGVPVIGTILESMPANAPPIVITQHMPAQFTSRFAHRIDETCAIKVQEARHGQKLLSGNAYIAPGGYQMRLKRLGNERRLDIIQDAKVNGFCPSVDVLFNSVAQSEGHDALGVILTGMGFDGAAGLLAMRRAGAVTLGQDEATSVVYGMPRAAFECGAVERQVSLTTVSAAIIAQVQIAALKQA